MVQGYLNESWQPFEKGINFDAFIIRKKRLNLLKVRGMDMENYRDKKTEDNKRRSQQTISTVKYSDSSFFKKKDEKAKKFLEKHPIPNTFWE